MRFEFGKVIIDYAGYAEDYHTTSSSLLALQVLMNTIFKQQESSRI